MIRACEERARDLANALRAFENQLLCPIWYVSYCFWRVVSVRSSIPSDYPATTTIAGS